MNNPGTIDLGSKSPITSALTDHVITSSADGSGVNQPYVGDLDDMGSVTFDVEFNYGSGGTTAILRIYTSLNLGVDWIECARFDFATASRRAQATVVAAGADVAVAGALSAEGVRHVLGPMLKAELTTTGTYGGNTSIEVKATGRGSAAVGNAELVGGLAAILAKIIAAPATEAKQDEIKALIGEVQSDPTADTLLARLKSLLTGIVLAASPNEIGKVNVKHINVAGATLTRPNNSTPYTANDSISDNGTAGSVTALSVTVSDNNDAPVDITEVLLDTTDTGVGGKALRIHVFNSDPTANSGVGAGDNAAWSNKRAGWVGTFSGTMQAFSDGAKGTLVSDGAPVRIVNVESGGQRLWYQLQTLSDFTPSANSSTFTPRFKGYQGRA